MHHTGMPTWQGGDAVEFVIFPVYKFVSVSYITIILESGAVGNNVIGVHHCTLLQFQHYVWLNVVDKIIISKYIDTLII